MERFKDNREFMKSRFKDNREFMKSRFKDEVISDQNKEIKQPPLEKPFDETGRIINLPKPNKNILIKKEIHECINDRRSHREYINCLISIDELSYLLWSTQGVHEIRGDNYATVRTVPSAGARHPFETYLAVNKVEGLQKGIYRYLAIEHQLLFLYEENDIEQKITDGTLGQRFAGTAAVNFIWSCTPYRGEWRYDYRSHKVMLLDAGHVCQNLYNSCEALGLGTCAIASYDQELMDEMTKIDGEEEFVVYMAPVGRV